MQKTWGNLSFFHIAQKVRHFEVPNKAFPSLGIFILAKYIEHIIKVEKLVIFTRKINLEKS